MRVGYRNITIKERGVKTIGSCLDFPGGPRAAIRTAASNFRKFHGPTKFTRFVGISFYEIPQNCGERSYKIAGAILYLEIEKNHHYLCEENS